MAFVERDGVKLAYDAAGRGEPGLLFVHGWSCDRTYFQPQYDHFAETRAVATMDLRGHGESDQPAGGYDMANFAADVAAVAAAAGMDRPIVVGHSMGGTIALATAASGSARAAVLVDCAPILITDANSGFFEESIRRFGADDDGSARQAFVQGMFLPTDRARREEIIAEMPTRPPAIAAACIQSMLDFDGAAALSQCAVPVLSIGSAVPSNVIGELGKHCKSITVGQTVGAGHFHQLEVPDQVNAMIAKFFEVNGL